MKKWRKSCCEAAANNRKRSWRSEFWDPLVRLDSWRLFLFARMMEMRVDESWLKVGWVERWRVCVARDRRRVAAVGTNEWLAEREMILKRQDER